MNTKLNQEEIIQYYDNCQIDYEVVWHLKSRMAMHYGYFEKNTKRLRDALTNMNKAFADFGKMRPNTHILDAGCGVGGSSIFLAQNYNAQTVGITLSDKQVAKSRENAIKHGVANKCVFEKQNYLRTNFPDNSFDFVWAIESVCYAVDKADFLREAYRILKPGGKVMIADFFQNDDDNNKDSIKDLKLMQKWTKTWAISSYAGVNEFWEKLNETGFVETEKKDIGEYVQKSIRRLYVCSQIGLPITYVAQMLGYRNRTQTANTWSSYYQYKAWKKDLWRYLFFQGTKP